MENNTNIKTRFIEKNKTLKGLYVYGTVYVRVVG